MFITASILFTTIIWHAIYSIAAKPNLIKFGDCAIRESRTLTFTMTNHSQKDCIKFVWPEHPYLTFSPTTGHIHAGRYKDMTVTFKPTEPVNMAEEVVNCAITKLTFDMDTNQVS